MPITFARPGTQVLMALASNSETKHANLDSTLALPHHVYTVAIADVRQSLWRPIGPIATRVLQVSAGAATNAYEVSAGPDGMPEISSTTVEGPALKATIELIEQAERVCGNRSLEFRLLRAPFLHMFVAWLHNADEMDVFLPQPLDEMEEETPLTDLFKKGLREGWNVSELMEALQGMADNMDRLTKAHQPHGYRSRRGD